MQSPSLYNIFFILLFNRKLDIFEHFASLFSGLSRSECCFFGALDHEFIVECHSVTSWVMKL